MNNTTLIFVYGSLKAGLHNHYILEHSNLLCTHVTAPIFTMISFDAYPAVLLNGTTAIHGEVYSVSEDIFAEVAELEGFPFFYNRVEIETKYGTAFMYVMDEVIGEYCIVDSGIWK